METVGLWPVTYCKSYCLQDALGTRRAWEEAIDECGSASMQLP